MVHLQILSGNKTGCQFTKSRFPILVGRDAGADISLDDPGVWPRHLQITRESRGLVCRVETNALVRINDAPVDEAVLRNGDVISIGALKILFTLAPVRQSSLVAREWLVWIALALLCLAQVALIGRLIR
jgi:pSer/pThr/pTyr-binding forkhead associated (FHA) protein